MMRKAMVCTLAVVMLLVAAQAMSQEAIPVGVNTSLGVFLLLVLAWSANVLVDGEKPDWFKCIAAFGLIFVLCWLFYRYSGTEWNKLGKSFFNFEKMVGAWPQLFEGLLVTLELAVISAVFSILIGLIVAVLRSFNSPTMNVFLIAYLDLFRSIPMIVLMSCE